MKKLVGFVLVLIGIVIIVVNKFLQNIDIPFISGFDSKTVLSVSIVLIAVGALLFLKIGSKKENPDGDEVPIYKNKKIVGYRRK